MTKVAAANQCQRSPRFDPSRDRRILNVNRLGADRMHGMCRMLPRLFLFQFFHGPRQFLLQPVLPATVERGRDPQSAGLDLERVKQGVELPFRRLKGVGRLGVEVAGRRQHDRLRGQAVTASLINHPHDNQTIERLLALLHGRGKIPPRRKNMRTPDDAHQESTFTVAQLGRRFVEIRAGRLLNALGSRAEINAVEIMGEDLVLGIAVFQTQGQCDFQQLPMQ